VWSGYDRHLDRRVAIKLMHHAPAVPTTVGDAESAALAKAAADDQERFLREIRTTARLELPGVPAVYDYGIDSESGRIYLVMQLLYGQTLAELIDSRDYDTDPWPVSWAAAIVAQVASTLVDVHRVDVVHRDIKPANLMVTDGGLVKVLDFGVAILRGASALPRLTRVGMTVGSPPYMPPEQALGNPVGAAADVYALGCVLFEALTGRVPFVETPHRSYQDQHVHAPVPSLRAVRPDVPAEIDALIRAMLAKRVADRPSAEAVYEALLPLAARPDDSGRDGGDRSGGRRDPRRPFFRPLAPAPRRTRPGAAPPAATRQEGPPLTVDDLDAIRRQVADLVDESHYQQAIDLLDDALARSAADPALRLDVQIVLASTLWVADEYRRLAAVIDDVLPRLADGDDVEPTLRYYAGVSHAELGNVDAAIAHLQRFLEHSESYDPLHRDAAYRLGVLLSAAGRADEGLRLLEALRPSLVAEYGPNSTQVNTLDQRIARIRAARKST